MFDRRLVQNFDWGLLGLILLLGLVGGLTLYSAVTAGEPSPQSALYLKQLVWFCCGLGAMIFSFLFSYKLLERWAYALYILCIVLLVSVLFFGKHVGGATRWLVLGSVSLQPSEPLKIGVILVLARYYSKHASATGLTLRQLIVPAVLILIPFFLVVRQPDLGSAMLLLLIAATMTFFVKIERRTLLCLIGAGAVMVPVVSLFLKDYQKQRILTLFNPDRDPLGAGYHIIQSKIAIGSGMISGKGFLKGTQNALSFLPEQHTDFIFSVLAEEWGFAGSTVLLAIFLMLIIRGIHIAYGSRDTFGMILSVGVVAMIFFPVLINIGMVMGLMPVVGVPLPLISYGGSSTVTVLISIGLLLNVGMRRFMF